jgi:hypothetical protein
MAFWSRLRSLFGLADRPAAAADSEEEAASAPADAASPAGALDLAADAPPPGDAAAPGMAGTIEDWNAASATGQITLSDGAELLFGVEACQGFTPLLGLRVEVLATGLPPEGAQADPAERNGPALWATRLRLPAGSESEYAARLRISQVERAVRGQVERVINLDKEGSPQSSAPPWARRKAGKQPAGPARPQDAFFALTVVLGRELPEQAAALSTLLHSPVWPKPTVRIIPLSRKGQREAGFSAEIVSGHRRAFLLYRPQPYAAADDLPQGVAHVGLFVGGPHSPRALTRLPAGVASTPLPLSTEGEPRLVAALARALLQHDESAPGLVVNRAGKAWKPRDIALSQLGPDTAEDDGDEAPLPFLLWIDWNVGERGGSRCQKSCGMESLGLPDIAVYFASDSEQDRARDALWFACSALVAGQLADDEQTLRVPVELKLQPGSRLLADAEAATLLYRVRARDEQWIELEATGPLPA